MKSCPQCGADVTSTRAKYCGQACARRAYSERRIADGRLAEQRSKHAEKRAAWMKANRKALRQAESNQRYERKRARAARSAARRTAAAFRLAAASAGSGPGRLLAQGMCDECGVKFVTTVNNDLPRFCSEACKGRHSSTVRRARTRLTRRGVVRRQWVYQRDQWCCQICGDPVERSNRVPHPLAATLDHVVPLALGGEHTEANLQLAHFRCNTVKGARAA